MKINKTRAVSRASTLVISTVLMGMTPALAQTEGTSAQSQDNSTVNDADIVVTATRREETLRTVPVSVTAVTGTAIQARGITNVENLASSVPNLAVRPAAATRSAAVLTIRGQVQRDNLPTLDPSVGVYVDDTYLARSFAVLTELLDVQRVEVLRGPQGTLFGRNTIGGAIRIITNKPDVSGGLTGTFSASVGNFGLLEMSGAVTVPLIQDRLYPYVRSQRALYRPRIDHPRDRHEQRPDHLAPPEPGLSPCRRHQDRCELLLLRGRQRRQSGRQSDGGHRAHLVHHIRNNVLEFAAARRRFLFGAVERCTV
jgi:outer membrane receptor protein involved in Fe transport